jgi:hypothetical protein
LCGSRSRGREGPHPCGKENGRGREEKQNDKRGERERERERAWSWIVRCTQPTRRQGKKKKIKSHKGRDGGPAEENKGKHGRELNKTKQGEDATCEKCEEEEKKRRESEV